MSNEEEESDIMLGYKFSTDKKTFELIITCDDATILDVHNVQAALLTAMDFVAEHFNGTENSKAGLH